MTDSGTLFFNREMSWLSFNHRVLQEAADASVPLLKRLQFLAIFSSNLDEYFRVRVASLRALDRAGPQATRDLGFSPREVLRAIHETVLAQQNLFGDVLHRRVFPELARRGMVLVRDFVDAEQRAFARDFFERQAQPVLAPVLLGPEAEPPFLRDRRVYLVAQLWPRNPDPGAGIEPQYGMVDLPVPALPRFVVLPGDGPERHVMFLDDLLRHFLPALFPAHEVGAVHAVKLSRDAELHLGDEFAGDIVQAIRRSLRRRETGVPCRFLYDPAMPPGMLHHLQQHFGIAAGDLLPGGRYHNLHDLFDFPRLGRDDLDEPAPAALPHPGLDAAPSVLDAVVERDHLLHFPYQSMDYLVRLLDEAAAADDVEEVWITLYRVARDSRVVAALIRAAQAGKRVVAFMEVTARFDEAQNLEAAERLEAAGVRTLYSLRGLKVHAKLALVVRRAGVRPRRLAVISTGNFNEKTARLYTDDALLTADRELTREVRRVFAFLAGETPGVRARRLLVAPFSLRRRLYRLIQREIRNHRAGRPAGILLKLNSLEDPRIIRRLYRAGRAGVPVQLIVRGICCLVPGVPGLSETIQARSIVDRYLEHSRVYCFQNGGEPRWYLASADWMERNLSRRVEVAVPVRDPALREQLAALMALQLADTRKARILDERQQNRYAEAKPAAPVRAQAAAYALLAPEAPPAHAIALPG
jgi:polyphosphate kinase